MTPTSSAKPIRLCFALTSPVRGGVEEVVLALLRRLDPAEFRLAIAAPGPLLDAFAPDLVGVRVDTVAVTAESWTAPRSLATLARFFRRWRPDLVNPHLFRSTVVAAPLARLAGVPGVIETYHGREGWRQGRMPGTFLVDRTIARLLDRVIAVSKAAGRFLVEGKGYPADRVVVVPNGRDLTAFAPADHREAVRKELGLDDGVPLIGVVGRLETQKGHGYLLDAWPAILREFPDARLAVIGDGSLRNDLERQTHRLGIAASIVFLGFRTDMPRLLDGLDGLALPSLYEGMPLTVIEASAMACPVVATAVDGTPEVIENDVTGWLVPPADPPALARAVVRLLSNPDRARAIGRAGRERVLRQFDLGRQVEATVRVYRSVARERS